jgi:hypothetical protein
MEELQQQVSELKTQYDKMWNLQQHMMIFLGSFLRDYAPIQGAPGGAAAAIQGMPGMSAIQGAPNLPAIAAGKAAAAPQFAHGATVSEIGSRSSSSSSMQPAQVPSAASSQLVLKQSPSHAAPQPPAPPALPKPNLPEHQMILQNLLQKSDMGSSTSHQQPAKKRKVDIPPPSALVPPSTQLSSQTASILSGSHPIGAVNASNYSPAVTTSLVGALPPVPLLSPTASAIPVDPLNHSVLPPASISSRPTPVIAGADDPTRWLPSPRRAEVNLSLGDDLGLDFEDEEDPLDLNQFI